MLIQWCEFYWPWTHVLWEMEPQMGSIQFSQNWSKIVSFERGAQNNGKTRRATFFLP
jgi:hypothetical protein